jgi:hypothetical protein
MRERFIGRFFRGGACIGVMNRDPKGEHRTSNIEVREKPIEDENKDEDEIKLI